MTESMSTLDKLFSLMDLLDATIDEMAQDHEGLLDAYNALLKENDSLKDTIAIMYQEKAQDDHAN